MRLFRIILTAHAVYILITAIWPIIHIESFMVVTGPKTDIWLVKTVGALLVPVALCMLSFLRSTAPERAVLILGAGVAIAFIVIDVYYALSDVISDIYLADALVEVVFLAGWMYQIRRLKNEED